MTTALRYHSGDMQIDRWHELVDVNGEANIPTRFSVSLLTAGAVAVATLERLTRVTGGRDAAGWWFVARSSW